MALFLHARKPWKPRSLNLDHDFKTSSVGGCVQQNEYLVAGFP